MRKWRFAYRVPDPFHGPCLLLRKNFANDDGDDNNDDDNDDDDDNDFVTLYFNSQFVYYSDTELHDDDSVEYSCLKCQL